MFAVLLTAAKVAFGLATAYTLYRVCASESLCPEVVYYCAEFPGEHGEEEFEEDVEQEVGSADGSEEVPSEDSGGEMQSDEQVYVADRVAQTQGSQDVGAEVPEEDGVSKMQGDEQVNIPDQVVQLQGSMDMVKKVPKEDNGDLAPNSEHVGAPDRAVQVSMVEEVPAEDDNGDMMHGGEQVDSSDRAVPVHVDVEVPIEDNRGEEAEDVQEEAGRAQNGGGEVVAQGVVAPPVLYNDEHNWYNIDFGYQIPCEEVTSFLPGWSPQYVFGGPELGRGAFGSVQLCQDEYGWICALKTVEFRDEFDAESKRPMVKKEVELQARCAGAHIVGAYGCFGTDYEMNSAFEFARFGMAESYVFQQSDIEGRAVSERRAAYVIRDIARALETCHNRGVAHCDVKLANVLVCENNVLKLSDFGLAVQVEEDGLTNIRSFEPQFVAPEFRGNGRYGTKVDMWALGILLYELLQGTRRWHLVICSAGRDYIPGTDQMAEDARDLLTKLLSEDPDDRPTAREVLAHPWVQRNVDES